MSLAFEAAGLDVKFSVLRIYVQQPRPQRLTQRMQPERILNRHDTLAERQKTRPSLRLSSRVCRGFDRA